MLQTFEYYKIVGPTATDRRLRRYGSETDSLQS